MQFSPDERSQAHSTKHQGKYQHYCQNHDCRLNPCAKRGKESELGNNIENINIRSLDYKVKYSARRRLEDNFYAILINL